MNIHLDTFTEGLLSTMLLKKQGEDIFNMGNVSMFPTSQSQAMWKYSKDPKTIRLSDGNHVYNFALPEGEKDDTEFPLERGEDLTPDKFVSPGFSSGRAQVHRSDPGSIYFTLQEGTKNPTYTFRHVGGTKWRALPKKKVVKKPKEAPVFNLPTEMAKQGFAKEFIKQGGFDQFLGQAINDAPSFFRNVATAPAYNPLAAAATGALAGGGYHLGKKYLYNTEEENKREEQDDPHALLKRVGLPTLALGATGAIERTMLPDSFNAQRKFGLLPNVFGDPYNKA